MRDLGKRTEPLPVIVDEVLVNFDPERAQRAARAFRQLSAASHVLVFACQPTVVELFRAEASSAGCQPPEVVGIG